MKNIGDYITKWFFRSIVVLLPSIYLFYCWITKGEQLSLGVLALFLAIGWIITDIYRGWHRTCTIHVCKATDTDSTKKNLFDRFIDSSIFQWVYFGILIGFFVLTFVAMRNGLDFLFNGAELFFQWFFTTVVTITLLWLVIMISKGKNWFLFFCFYLIFDILSAFTFNYIHFYDKVSQTQSMDRDVAACSTYLNLRMPLIEKLYTYWDPTGDSTRVAKLDVQAAKAAQEMETAGNQYVNRENPESIKAQKVNMSNANKQSSNVQTRREAAYFIYEQKMKMFPIAQDAVGFCDGISTLYDQYKRDEKKFTHGQLDTLKAYVAKVEADVQMMAEAANANIKATNAKAKNDTERKDTIQYTSETIDWAMSRVQRPMADRFEGLTILVEKVTGLFDTSADTSAIGLINQNHGQERPNAGAEDMSIAEKYKKEEKDFKDRLFIQSISMSAIIDIAPLLLGLFVSLTRRKDTYGE